MLTFSVAPRFSGATNLCAFLQMFGIVWYILRRLHDAYSYTPVRCALDQRPRLELVHDDDDARQQIYKARHAIYAEELQQYPSTRTGALSDYTDAYNVYIAAKKGRLLQGFVAITPPGHRKGFQKHGVVPVKDDSHEVRLLSVLQGCRGQGVSSALMYAALRYVEASGGKHIEAMARREVLPLYMRIGMRPVSQAVIQVGDVTYTHLCGHVDAIMRRHPKGMVWGLPFPMDAPLPCTHGGKGLDVLDPEGINADVLDAWFPPAPSVVRNFVNHTSDIHITPPANPTELVDTLSSSKNLPSRCFVLGTGSSDLIYRCLFAWLTPASKVLLLSPTYAEYQHVLHTIGCSVTEWKLDDNHRVQTDTIPAGQFDLVVMCNPNSPTGILHENMIDLLHKFPSKTRVWVDETYMEYAGMEHSVEPLVMTLPNLVVCTSMSKAYALSGLRVGYVCAHPTLLDGIRGRSPPWMVSRVAQRAATEALKCKFYYAERYKQTHALRKQLALWLDDRGWKVVNGSCANFVMCTPPAGHTVDAVVKKCAAQKLYIRKVDETYVRIAIKDPETVETMQQILDVAAPLSST